jgi:DNA modification methylase
LRDYGNDGQIGLEQTPDEYIIEMVNVFREVWRVLKDDGTVWLNLGDSYSGSGKGPAGNLGSKHNERHLENKHSAIVPQGLKPKDLIGIPWKVAFALQADGWYLRQDIIWAKPNPMPESVQDRCTRSHEYLFLLTKSAKYYFDNQAIKEDAVTGSWDKLPPIGGKKHQENGNPTYSGNQPASDGKRNKRDVWTINTKPFKGAHFAVMPEALVEPCILAGSRGGDLVLDPFTGSGTVGVVAKRHNRNFVGVELNPEYAQIAEERIGVDLFD